MNNYDNYPDTCPPVTGKIGPKGKFGGRKYLYFAGNNYLDLARRPELINAATEASKKYGTSSGAGRTTTGTSDLHLELEEVLAEFKGTEDALIYPSGYLGNQIMLSGILQEDDVLVYDEWAHTSITEALPRTPNRAVEFAHNDMEELHEVVNSADQGVVLVNGVDPILGELAPLDRILEVVDGRDFRVLVDDAHGTGVLGRNGRGTPEHFGLSSDKILQTEVMSKALGSHGGFIASSRKLIDKLRVVSNTYRGSTPLPPSVTAASIAAVKIVMDEPELREKVKENAAYLVDQLTARRVDADWSGSAIVRLDISEEAARGLHDHLQNDMIIAPYTHYPTLDSPGRLRITVSARHSKEDVDCLVNSVTEYLRE